MKNEMIEYRKNIFQRIKEYFKKLVYKEHMESEHIQLKEQDRLQEEKNNKKVFSEEIKIQEDIQEKRILKLQEQFEKGQLQEKDINDDDYTKLEELYEKQIQEAEHKLEIYKDKILKIRNKYHS